MKTTTLIIAALCSSAALAADVLWVDKSVGDNSTAAKNDESRPYSTIQAAVNAAASGDEVRVKPGVYDTGSMSHNDLSSASRVLINNKRLKIVSTGGAGVTHIVGTIHAAASTGLGSTAVRCIGMRNAQGTVIEGFTLRDGATKTTDTDTHPMCAGGAVMAVRISDGTRFWHPTNAFVVGCIVTNCYGQRGAAFRGVTALRCRIEGNRGDNSGAAGRDCSFVNCLIADNRGPAVVNNGKLVVGCTFVNNEAGVIGNASSDIRVLNSVVIGNNGSDAVNINYAAVSNSLTYIENYNAHLRGLGASNTNASPYQFVSPLSGDWRVLRGSEAEAAGDASLLECVQATLPEGVDAYKDLFGNEIPKAGPIAAGCCQTVVDPLPYGGVVFTDAKTVLFDGKKILGRNLYVCTDTWPTQYTFQAVNKGNPAIYAFNVGGTYVFPTMDDTIYISPTGMGTYISCSVKAATSTMYVNPDPTIGSDSTKDGTNPGTPYRTIQAANSAAYSKGGNYSVVRAAPGDYNEGGAVNGSVSNRLQMARHIRILGAGRDKSIIRGHPSPNGGMGSYAMRCVYRSGGGGCVQGFTLADGYTNSGSDGYATRGGGVYCNASSFDYSFRILDCTITNCWSVRGGAGYSGQYERCHVVDCHATGGVIRYARFISSVVDNLDDAAMADTANAYGRSYYSTFVGKTTKWVIHKSDATLVNCIVARCKSLTGPAGAVGCFAWEVPTMTAASITKADPKFVDLDGGDYHPTFVVDKRENTTYGSPTLGGGEWRTLIDANLADFDGKPLNLVNGRPTAGAFQWPEVTVIKNGFMLILR